MVNSFGFNSGTLLNFQQLQNQQGLLNRGINFGFGGLNGLNGQQSLIFPGGNFNFGGLNGFNGFQSQQGIFGPGAFGPPPPPPEQMFATMDANGDGTITQDEFENAPAPPDNGQLNIPAPTAEMKAQMWARLDADGDNQVTQAEFLQAGPPPGGPHPGGFGGPGFNNPQLQAAKQQFETDLATAGIDPQAVREAALSNAISGVTDATLQAKLQTDLANVQALGDDEPTPGTPPDPQRMAAHRQLETDLRAAGIDMRAIHDEAMKTAISGVTDTELQAKLQTDLTTLDSLRPQPPIGGGQFLQLGGFGQNNGFGAFGLGNNFLSGFQGLGNLNLGGLFGLNNGQFSFSGLG